MAAKRQQPTTLTLHIELTADHVKTIQKIAASYDQLLEACKAARKLFDQGCVDRGFKDEHNWIDEALDKIDSALAAATGETE